MLTSTNIRLLSLAIIGASERDIKKAYKRLAMKFHPDRNQGDESAADKFKEVCADFVNAPRN